MTRRRDMKQMMRPEDLALRWEMDVKTVRAAIEARWLPSVRLGKRTVLIPRRAVERREELGAEPSAMLNSDKAAAFLGVSRSALVAACLRGEVPHRRVGRRLVFSRPGLIRWVDGAGQDHTAKEATDAIAALVKRVHAAECESSDDSLGDQVLDEFREAQGKGHERYTGGFQRRWGT